MKLKTTHYATLALFALTVAAGTFSTGCASTRTSDSTGEYIDDSTITAKVKANLMSDDVVKSHQVSVETFKGVVQLSGFVDTSEQKDRAGQIASAVAGVKDVKNSIVVKPSSS